MWRDDFRGLLRTVSERCPITFVCEKMTGHIYIYHPHEYEDAARALDLNESLITLIVCAADGRLGHDFDLRKQLFKACGLLGEV